MSTLKLTKTKMMQGVWQGIVTQSGDGPPRIEVTHQKETLTGVTLEEGTGCYRSRSRRRRLPMAYRP